MQGKETPQAEEEMMTAGLFVLRCPECGGVLAIDQFGTGTCAPCQRSYLNRFGHLIPVEFRQPEPDPAVLPVQLG